MPCSLSANPSIPFATTAPTSKAATGLPVTGTHRCVSFHAAASALILTCLVSGCSGALHGGTFNLHDTGNVLPALGINDGFHGPLPADVVARYCGHTIRTPQLSAEGLQAYYASLAACPSMKTIVLVEAPDVALVAAIAPLLRPGDALELGNELELRPYELTVGQYAEWIMAARFAAWTANPNAKLITGGVFTLNSDTKPYLLAAKAACPDCTLGIHLYEDLSDADLRWLTALGRPLVVGEFGLPTRCRPTGGAEQREWIGTQWARFALVPSITLAVIYQRPVGPTCSDYDTFGIAGQPAEEWFR